MNRLSVTGFRSSVKTEMYRRRPTRPSFFFSSDPRSRILRMRIALGADHAGFELKQKVRTHLEQEGHEVNDLGTNSTESVDYPDFAQKVAHEVAGKRADYGVLVCGSGIGMFIAANNVGGIP